VQRGSDGQARLMLVDDGGVVRERVVSTGAMVGSDWQITQGLAAGEQVVIERVDKVSAGALVKAEAEVKTDAVVNDNTLAGQQARN
jgi:multidrug efflux system membrane fusion protein